MRLRAILSIPEAAVSPAFQQQLEERHSPVPYLIGGLAAMLGLIAFALLVLACSYWKLSGYPERGAGDTNGEGEEQRKKAAEGSIGWENNVVVIMAGQVMPTFLATPSTSRSSSFGDNTASSDCRTASVDSICEGDEGGQVAL